MGWAVSAKARKSLHPSPSPPDSQLYKQLLLLGPPVSRVERPCPYSWMITPLSSAPSVGAPRYKVLFTRVDWANACLNALPSDWLTNSEPIVTVSGNVLSSAINHGRESASLAITTPTAPAACAAKTCALKLHAPRSNSAILPLIAPLLLKGD